MIELGPATEDEMVLAFLMAEIDSPRFGQHYQDILTHRRQSRAALIDHGDLTNAADNQARIELLKTFRGYTDNASLFKGFPRDVQWRRTEIESDELERLKYGKFEDWIRLSGGSRKVVDGARNIDGIQTGESLKVNIEAVVKKINSGHRFAELIVVQADSDNLVIVEGHTRAAAYVLAQPSHPIELLIGSSSQLEQWRWY